MGNPKEGPAVLTGHGDGIITVNIAEADDVERERRRVLLHEPYRTLLGHFRHEIGHYYWDLLIKDSPHIDEFRTHFGDERADYDKALKEHYDRGAVPDWRSRFISGYASVHPWEDWAETWAHYLHMTDTLETAAVCGLSLHPDRPDEPAMEKQPNKSAHEQSFDEIIGNWFPLTYVLNSLNRGMGMPDAYPFVLPRRRSKSCDLSIRPSVARVLPMHLSRRRRNHPVASREWMKAPRPSCGIIPGRSIRFRFNARQSCRSWRKLVVIDPS